ncbi:hypothetical protein T492DRAFT_837351 [Pavlovales sp. CCMP2436]|nr:hypothetical protein T492DRAFT_837351 [Pavlovales sp. CCMP2436]
MFFFFVAFISGQGASQGATPVFYNLLYSTFGNIVGAGVIVGIFLQWTNGPNCPVDTVRHALSAPRHSLPAAGICRTLRLEAVAERRQNGAGQRSNLHSPRAAAVDHSSRAFAAGAKISKKMYLRKYQVGEVFSSLRRSYTRVAHLRRTWRQGIRSINRTRLARHVRGDFVLRETGFELEQVDEMPDMVQSGDNVAFFTALCKRLAKQLVKDAKKKIMYFRLHDNGIWVAVDERVPDGGTHVRAGG